MNNRSDRFAQIADALGATCCASIDNAGQQISNTLDGRLWSGTLFYAAGEMKRVRGADLRDIHGKNFVEILSNTLRHSTELPPAEKSPDHTILRCFASMGLAMLGSAEENPVLQALTEVEREQVFDNLRVLSAYDNNWEAFNACLRIGRTTLYGEEPDRVIPHLQKLADKYLATGYFDDSKECGVYNCYGLMSINYALRIGEFMEEGHPVRSQIDELFQPHALRHFKLLQTFIHRTGQGWLFGRSAGCLGQLQCLVFIEQLLSRGWLTPEQEAWSRRASIQILDYMYDTFWDADHNWFSFRDENRSCYSYRTTLPMTWDLWRYFLQLEEYAKIDEAKNPTQETDDQINDQPICCEIITSTQRNTAYLVWSDGIDRIQLPIMGGPGYVSGDTLPRPYCPGLFEWVTELPIPVLCPRLTIGKKHYWPAWWPSSTSLKQDGNTACYTVEYPHLVDDHGNAADFDIRWTATFLFSSGRFERHDAFQLGTDLTVEQIRMEILQGTKHPTAITYPPVRQLTVSGDSSIAGVTLGDAENITRDKTYVNYYSHASKRWVFEGINLSLQPGTHELKTVIDYE